MKLLSISDAYVKKLLDMLDTQCMAFVLEALRRKE